MNGLIKNVVYALMEYFLKIKKELESNTPTDNADEPYRHYST